MALSDDKIQDYIDGRLSERESAVVAATLMANPVRMRAVLRLRLLNQMLCGVGVHILAEPVPDRLIEAVRGAFEEGRRRTEPGVAREHRRDRTLRQLGPDE